MIEFAVGIEHKLILYNVSDPFAGCYVDSGNGQNIVFRINIICKRIKLSVIRGFGL
ncbi:hypothetical protein ROA7745_04633 [Roseovarius aestuarii]|uniref:Uncharacterized protein n=1 Tax=Roseovarius aestuarii TaxID=475083 RepID=A0A1X7BYW1_9RHOB|nr:hypothetical protein ROA7745_04633 [Roseovarius aestuarii]